MPSGVDMAKQNYRDKDWLVFVISTLSNGKDEIFGPKYLPKTNYFRESIA